MTRHQWRRPEGKKGGLLREEKSRLGTGRTERGSRSGIDQSFGSGGGCGGGRDAFWFLKKSEPWSLRLQYVLRAPHIGWAG